MGFRLTPKAEDDIIRIAETGTLLFGEAQALTYHIELFEMLELISSNPRMARERHEITPPVRVHPFKSHLIVYLLTEVDEILVVRIRHSREDWMEEL
ncbi:MAG: type II toxin-antitoxin system RelE/ParE family toxin [Alphaproteobacteria bacterium]|nr:type II toxin-antitoxin system RelE/ParE family toxin [Alphaproteobacteria bacterium]